MKANKKEESPYNPKFVTKVLEGIEQVKRGETRVIYDIDFLDMINQGDEDIKTGKGNKVDIDALWK